MGYPHLMLISQNITDVVAAIADLIRVKIPSSYEVSSGPGNLGAVKTSVEPQSQNLQQPNGPGPTRPGFQQLQLQQNHKSEQLLLVHVLPLCHKCCSCQSGVEAIDQHCTEYREEGDLQKSFTYHKNDVWNC